MKGVLRGLVCAAAVVSAGLSLFAQTLPCVGPSADSVVTPCSQALSPQDAARGFMESRLESMTSPDAGALASALAVEADQASAAPERSTMGLLYGVGRWGCDNGYTFHNLCEGNYYLEKETEAEYGYAVVYYVIVSSVRWNVFSIDRSFGATLMHTPRGDVQLLVLLSLRQKGAALPAHEAALTSQYSGQATLLQQEILRYCDAYKTAYCMELRSLAATLARSTPATSSTPPTKLTVTATAEGHLASSAALGLLSDNVSLLVVTGTVLDDRGVPVADAEVSLTGATSSRHTLSNGTYRISMLGTGTTLLTRRIDLTLERASMDLSVKPAAPGAAQTAIAADGVSRLAIAVASHGIRPDSVSVASPAIGDFERSSAGASPLVVDKDGNGTLVYVPPRVLPNEALTETLTVGSGASARTIPAARVEVSVRYQDLGGASRTATLSIRVCRPPVLLVQSDFGGKAPWSQFGEYAKQRRLDCYIIGEGTTWSLGNVSLTDWAKSTAASLSEVRAAYEASGIKTGAVDVVAHSLSGLVVRSLVEGPGPRLDVHKLILVGTPNHGLFWLDQEVAGVAVRWLSAHPTAAAEVLEGSAFLRGLELKGAAEPPTSYVNIVGRRTPALSAVRQGSSTVQDDGVVSAASAHLDGVAEIRFDGAIHGPGLELDGTALTESVDVWSRVYDFLVGEIPGAEPDALRVELRRGKQVSASIDPQSLPWTASTQIPGSLGDSLAIKTGDKGYASLAITQAGTAWGTISLDAKTQIVLHASSPSLVRVEVVSGRARLHSPDSASGVADFEVILDAVTRSSSWYTSQPDARVLAVSADVVTAREEERSSVLALAGTVIVESSKGVGFSSPRLVEARTGIRIQGGTTQDEAFPARGWWTMGVWREPIPFFYFPPAVMVVALLALAGAVAYRVAIRRRDAERSRRGASPPPRSP